MADSNIKKNPSSGEDIPLNFKFFIRVFLVIAGVAVFSYFAIMWAMESVIHSRKEVIVPDIKGKSALTALQILSENKLAMQISGFEFNDKVPVGTVLRQDPESGINAREGRIVKVVFSQGGESVFVPNIVGLPIRNAELLLRQRQLLLGEVNEAYSLKFTKGTVIFQEPKAETQVAKNTFVNVVVSAGSPPEGVMLMPDFRQKKIDEFYKWIENYKNLQYEIKREKNTIFPKDVIIDQFPNYDVVVNENTKIIITVSDRGDESAEDEEYKITYTLSKSGSERTIRIVAVSKPGDREIFNAVREPGSKIELAIPKSSAEKIRIFVNGILVEEREVK